MLIKYFFKCFDQEEKMGGGLFLFNFIWSRILSFWELIKTFIQLSFHMKTFANKIRVSCFYITYLNPNLHISNIRNSIFGKWHFRLGFFYKPQHIYVSWLTDRLQAVGFQGKGQFYTKMNSSLLPLPYCQDPNSTQPNLII